MNDRSRRRNVPDKAVVKVPSPGTNFATINDHTPQRSNNVWVCLTQVSGLMEIRQIVRCTVEPYRTPAAYQAMSARKQAAIAAQTSQRAE